MLVPYCEPINSSFLRKFAFWDFEGKYVSPQLGDQSARTEQCSKTANCNLLTHQALRSSCVRAFQIDLEFEGEGKISRSKEETLQLTQPTYGVDDHIFKCYFAPYK